MVQASPHHVQKGNGVQPVDSVVSGEIPGQIRLSALEAPAA